MVENNSGTTLTLEPVAEREPSPEPLFADSPGRLRERPPEPEAQEIGRRGREIYQKLRHELEARFNGQVLVIATDTEEYAIGETALAAADAILQKRPDAPLYGVRIGDDVLGRV